MLLLYLVLRKFWEILATHLTIFIHKVSLILAIDMAFRHSNLWFIDFANVFWQSDISIIGCLTFCDLELQHWTAAMQISEKVQEFKKERFHKLIQHIVLNSRFIFQFGKLQKKLLLGCIFGIKYISYYRKAMFLIKNKCKQQYK